jgi:hypothetical protein
MGLENDFQKGTGFRNACPIWDGRRPRLNPSAGSAVRRSLVLAFFPFCSFFRGLLGSF